MKVIKNWFVKKRMFKKYKGILRDSLKSRYGKSKNLTYKQVLSMLKELELVHEYDFYAYAMTLSKKQYKIYQKKAGIIYSQDALNIELGISPSLLKGNFPSGNYG